jgi:hypothetical protein
MNFRCCRPSLNTLLGITKAIKPVKTELGITAVLNWGGFGKVETASRLKIRGGRLLRNGLPRPGGCLVAVLMAVVLAIAAMAMAN